MEVVKLSFVFAAHLQMYWSGLEDGREFPVLILNTLDLCAINSWLSTGLVDFTDTAGNSHHIYFISQ